MKLITINSRIFSAKPAIVGSFLNKNLNFSPGWGSGFWQVCSEHSERNTSLWIVPMSLLVLSKQNKSE